MSLFKLAKAAATGANPGGELLHLFWKPLVGLLAITLVVVLWFAWLNAHDDAVKSTQRNADQAVIDAANVRGNRAIEANTSLAASELALRAAAEADRRERLLQDEAGAAALATANAARDQVQREADALRQRNARILATPSCQSAKRVLATACPIEEL